MKYDVIIANGTLFLSYGIMEGRDIGIKDGNIVEVSDRIERGKADMVIEATGKVVVPGFVDSHMHLDKAYVEEQEEVSSLLDACNCSAKKLTEYYYNWTKESIISDIMEKAEETIRKSIANGTTLIRTDTMLNPIVGTAALEAMKHLKEKYRDKIDILVTADCAMGMEREWQQAVGRGLIDFIGGYPNLKYDEKTRIFSHEKNAKEKVEKIFQLAKKYNLPIDIHCDESDEPDFQLFRYVCEQTWRNQMEGEVTVSHVTALDAKGANEEKIADAIAWCSKGSVQVTTLTSQNMYLMSDLRRGPTRVRQLRNAGVKVSVASDNVRDVFRPFGNCDLLEEALLTAQVHKFGTDKELLDIMRMITYFPADSCKLENYGLLPGCKANLVILDSDNVPEALRSQVAKKYVMHLGNIVAVDGKVI